MPTAALLSFSHAAVATIVPIAAPDSLTATEASQMVMDAINTVVQFSTWTLGILGFVVGVIAIFGWTVMRDATIKAAKQIANEKLDSYMKSDEFEALAFDLVQRAVDKRWQNTVVVQTFRTSDRKGGEASAFPTAPEREK